MPKFDFSVPDGALKRQLFERYDRLNAGYEAAELRLADMHIPHPIWFVYDSHIYNERLHPGVQEHYCLSLQKIKGKWRICHSMFDDTEIAPGSDEEPRNWTPIVEVAASLRVEAAKHLSKLEERVAESHRDFLAKVDEAIETVELFAQSNVAAGVAKKAKKSGG